MEYQNLALSLDEATGVQTVMINREKKLNALNKATMAELDVAFDEITSNPAVKAVVVTGAGPKAFVAGADISEFSTLTAIEGTAFAAKGQAIFSKIENCPKPVIAAINGFALGGGCELAMACHMRVAADNAKFGQPEVNLGIIPGYGGTQRMTQLVGKGKALELLTRGNMISAAEAAQIGLVNYKVPAENLMDKVNEILKDILTKAPVAISYVIESVNAEGNNGYQVEADTFGKCCETDDFKEGVSAFAEKRKPSFSGK
jgi:enoyl-CoA hydratase